MLLLNNSRMVVRIRKQTDSKIDTLFKFDEFQLNLNIQLSLAQLITDMNVHFKVMSCHRMFYVAPRVSTLI